MGLREKGREGGGGEREISPLVQSPHDLNVTHFETAHMNSVNTSWAILKIFPERLKATVGSVYIHISH